MWGRIRLRIGVATLRPPFWGVPPEGRHFVSVKTSARTLLQLLPRSLRFPHGAIEPRHTSRVVNNRGLVVFSPGKFVQNVVVEIVQLDRVESLDGNFTRNATRRCGVDGPLLLAHSSPQSLHPCSSLSTNDFCTLLYKCPMQLLSFCVAACKFLCVAFRGSEPKIHLGLEPTSKVRRFPLVKKLLLPHRDDSDSRQNVTPNHHQITLRYPPPLLGLLPCRDPGRCSCVLSLYSCV